jgi:hypothetical protein
LSVGATIILQESYEPIEAQELIAAEHVTSVRQMIHDEMRLVAAHEANPLSLESVTVGVVTDSLRQITRVPYEISGDLRLGHDRDVHQCNDAAI